MGKVSPYYGIQLLDAAKYCHKLQNYFTSFPDDDDPTKIVVGYDMR